MVFLYVHAGPRVGFPAQKKIPDSRTSLIDVQCKIPKTRYVFD